MMFRIAWRYIWGSRSAQAVQIISWVSVLAMTVGSAALSLVLSVFNGFEHFIKQLYSDYYPEIRINATAGRTFSDDSVLQVMLRRTPEIRAVSRTLEEKVLFSFDGSQVIATLKGVDEKYPEVCAIRDHMQYGDYALHDDAALTPAVLGIGLANRLGTSNAVVLPLTAYSFRPSGPTAMDLAQAYNSSYFAVEGLFGLQEEIDNQLALTNLKAVQDLSGREGEVSALEIALQHGANAKAVLRDLEPLLKKHNLKGQTRYEQNRTLYFILRSERWAVYAILTLMMAIASFNIVGSLSMLVIDKQRDIAILKAMGLQEAGLQRVFLYVGVLLALIGGAFGTLLAVAIALGQQYFGWVKLGGSGDFLMEAYPVRLQPLDFVLVLITVTCIAALASWVPARRAARRALDKSSW